MTRARLAGGVLALGLLVAGCSLAPRRVSDPLSPEEHNDLGAAYYARGRYELAAREFSRAARGRPDWARALANVGDAELAQGHRAAAVEAYERALRAGPDDPAIANNLAWALLQDPVRWPEAEALVQRALALEPQPRGYYLDTLGTVLLRKGETREALATFRAALADSGLRDRAARALVLRHAGEALARLGEKEGAARCVGLAEGLTAAGGADEVGVSEPLC